MCMKILSMEFLGALSGTYGGIAGTQYLLKNKTDIDCKYTTDKKTQVWAENLFKGSGVMSFSVICGSAMGVRFPKTALSLALLTFPYLLLARGSAQRDKRI